MHVIFDIDGTICDVEHRRRHLEGARKDWKAFNAEMHLDTPRAEIIHLAHTLERGGATIILATGREEVYREATRKWMADHGDLGLALAPLYMRPAKDYRSDVIVKREMLDAIRADGFMPTIAIDDRSSVVAMWREAGLVCLQCAEGDF